MMSEAGSQPPTSTDPRPPPVPGPPSFSQVVRVSLLLGLAGFGGGLSVLGLMENMLVRKRRWLTSEQFATTATVSQMLPGGAAANALAYIGLRLNGLAGALAAYAGFVTPGAVLVTALAWVYVKYKFVADAGAFLSGLNAAVVGVILAIAVRMSRTSVKRLWQMGITGAALVFSMVGAMSSGLIAILGIGAGILFDLGIKRARFARYWTRRKPSPPLVLPEEGTLLNPPTSSSTLDSSENHSPTAPPPDKHQDRTLRALAFPIGLASLALVLPHFAQLIAQWISLAATFFRVGLGAYGGGFAIIPSLHTQVVLQHLVTERQFADAVAVGKLTPGPVLLLATFVGYLKAGMAGAIISTISIMAAPFLLVVILASWLERVQTNRWIQGALRGLTPSVVGMMIAAALTLGQSIKTGIGAAIAAVVALTLMRFERVNPVILLALAGIARAVYHAVTGI